MKNRIPRKLKKKVTKGRILAKDLGFSTFKYGNMTVLYKDFKAFTIDS